MLSVIIPVFNRPKPLLIGLESVLRQRGVEDEIEIIVVDDHSDTALRLEGWPVRLIRLQKNGGPAAARNAGLSAATGETIAFLDSDDAWLPDKLNHQLNCLREVSASNPGALHAVTCGFYYESGIPRRLYGRMPVPARSLRQFATGCWFSPGSTLLISRAAFSHVGLFNERQRSLEDFEWFLRFAHKGGHLAVAPHFDVVVRRNQERRTEDQVAEAAKIIVGAFDKHASDRTWQRRAKAYLSFELSLARLREGRHLRSFSPSTLGAMVSSYFRLRKNYASAAAIPEHVISLYRQMLRAYLPRVIFVIYSLGLGGTERHLSLILPVLKQRGYGVTLFNISGVHDRSLNRQLVQAGVDVRGIAQNHSIRTDVLRLLASVFGLIKCFALERPQIVHFFLPRAYLVGGPLAVMLRISRRVMSRRSLNNYQAKHKILARIERRLHRQMTAVSGNSQAVIDELCQREQVPSERLHLIYNGIPLNSCQENDRGQGRAAMGLASDCLVLIIVANLVFYKGHADLLYALAEIKAALPENWTLLIVGGDSGAGAPLKAQTRKLGLLDHVRFVGLQRNVPELLALSDIAILVSHEEGFSNSVLEAMAAGLPVIATSVGGNPEAVVEGSTGLLVPPKNPSALAQAILRLANDPAARQQMGAKGHARVEKHFSLEACVSGYEALYSSILNRSDAP